MEELKKYFQEHQDKFRKPESVTLSEIFLSSAGKNEAEVKARALELVRQLRAGADFAKVASAKLGARANGVRIAPETGGRWAPLKCRTCVRKSRLCEEPASGRYKRATAN